MELYAIEIASNYRWGPLLNALVLPFAFGAIAAFLYRGFSILRVILVALIPVISLSPILFEDGDPAKPGLEYVFYYGFIIAFSAGGFAEIGVYYLCKYFKLKSREHNVEKHA
jgi:hypothetical protein